MPGRRRTDRELNFELVFYEDENGREPVLDWMRGRLSPSKRRALGLAMRHYLQRHGASVAATSLGRQLGEGLIEFRLDLNLAELVRRLDLPLKPTPEGGDEDELLLRVFFHPYGDRLILLLGGYDKGEDASKRRQQKEIALARKRLRRWQQLERQRSGRRR